MRWINSLTVATLVWVCLAWLTPGAALAVDSATLIEKSSQFDGRTVTFRGEVIGDVMVRREGVWLHINDDAYSRQGEGFRLAGYNKGQSVLAPPGTEKIVKRAGRYGQRGDIVEVSGIFRKASAKQGGDMMIEARSVKLVTPGFPLSYPISRRKILAAIGGLVFTIFILGLSRILGLKLI